MQRGIPYLAIVLVVTLGLAAWWQATQGFHAFTWESYRRLSIQEQPLRVSDLSLQGHTRNITELSALHNKVILLNFIYTRCPTVCGYAGYTFSRLQQSLSNQGYQDKVQLLSVSLDPQYDSPDRLREYLHRFTSRSNGNWLVARPIDPGQGERLLQELGVVHIPDGMGGITHNAATHIIDRQGRLVQIVDEDKPKAAMAAVTTLLADNPSERL